MPPTPRRRDLLERILALPPLANAYRTVVVLLARIA